MDAKTRQIQFMYLLERIGQPLYLSPRGQGKNLVVYNVPPDVLEEYEAKAMIDLRKQVPAGSDVTIVTISKTATPYDLTPVKVVLRNTHFTYLSPQHQEAADALTKILLSQPDITEFFHACALCRDAVNPHLWVHSFVTAILKREDMKGFVLPHFWEIAPDLFIETHHLHEAQKQGAFPPEDRAIVEVPINFTGFATNPEHRIAYFREDVGFNSFHWHFHLANPYTAPPKTINRKGELFYFVHHELIARYNAERLANGLNRVKPLYLESGSVIEEAYYSKLALQSSGRAWGSRQENTAVHDIDRTKDPGVAFPLYISDMRTFLDRIKEAIDAGFALSESGKKVDLMNEHGIDIVSAMLESSMDSVNLKYYGECHNNGHRIITFLHDPDFRYREGTGVMGSVATAIRDPAFFRWHYYIELIFRRHKELLKPYTPAELLFDGIKVEGVEIHTPSLDVDTLLTFWMQSDVDLSRGLDFQRTDVNNLGPIWARLTHLQHRDFEYKITVKNTGYSTRKATVRIFMAPKLDEQGDDFLLKEQRNLFFQLDKFTTTLRHGENLIKRKSTESALTIPWGQTFSKLERDQPTSLSPVQSFCGCGWPSHLLIPKGKHEGTPMDLFITVSDWEVDKVIDPEADQLTDTESIGCKDAIVLCGSLGRKYPDSRPMGYPLDRLPRPGANNVVPTTIEEFAKPYPNMIAKQVKIFHRDVTVVREGGAPAGLRVVQA